MVYIQSIYTYEEKNGKVVKDSYRKYMNGELVESRDLGYKKIKAKKEPKPDTNIRIIKEHKDCMDFLHSLLEKYGTKTILKAIGDTPIEESIGLLDQIAKFNNSSIEIINIEFNEKNKVIGFTLYSKKLPTIIKLFYKIEPSRKEMECPMKKASDKINQCKEKFLKTKDENNKLRNVHGIHRRKSK